MPEQEDRLLKYCESNNIQVKGIYREDFSAKNFNRPEWNKFFSLFGEEFKNKMIRKVKDDPQLDTSIKSFLEIGQERNKMVHQNFAEVVIDKTAEEIYKLYQSSLYFIETVKNELIKREQKA